MKKTIQKEMYMKKGMAKSAGMKKILTLGIVIIAFILISTSSPISVYADSEDLAFVSYDNSTLISTGTTKTLRGVSWKPDGSYALIVGENGTILKYDGNKFTTVKGSTNYSNFDLYSVAWAPSGDYALIVGEYIAKSHLGAILRYDNATDTITNLSSEVAKNGTSSMLQGIMWSPDGSYAMIVGDSGSVLTYNGVEVRNLSFKSGTEKNLYGITWNRKGTFSVCVGYAGTVLMYLSGSFSDMISYNIDAGAGISWLRSIAWKPNDDYGIIVGSRGTILKYDGSGYKTKTAVDSTKYSDVTWRNTHLNNISWRPDSKYAIIVGEKGTILKYGNESSIETLSTDVNTDLFSISWKPQSVATTNDSEYGGYALIVGSNGKVIKYPNKRPTPVLTVNSVVADVGKAVVFYGLNSFDDDKVEKYLFIFGDGTDSGWTTLPSARHAYARSGRYEASLRVTDSEGTTSTVTSKIPIVIGDVDPSNKPPTANAGRDIVVGENTTIHFYGEGKDTDGKIIYYQWDFDGDGIYDWNSTTTGAVYYKYPKSGVYRAVFRAIDDTGKEGKDTIVVKVGQAESFFIVGFDIVPFLSALCGVSIWSLVSKKKKGDSK
jgi:photosystem II stability/assembly factor-like uncharacterized protein